jgi:Zn ribbon nucleic-acid-binding protein
MNGVAYCDKKCQGIAKAKMWSEQRAKTNTECIICGKPLRKRESDLKDKNYCSNACRGKAMERNEPNAVCALCGNGFPHIMHSVFVFARCSLHILALAIP